jgi:hypothetical protein
VVIVLAFKASKCTNLSSYRELLVVEEKIAGSGEARDSFGGRAFFASVASALHIAPALTSKTVTNKQHSTSRTTFFDLRNCGIATLRGRYSSRALHKACTATIFSSAQTIAIALP